MRVHGSALMISRVHNLPVQKGVFGLGPSAYRHYIRILTRYTQTARYFARPLRVAWKIVSGVFLACIKQTITRLKIADFGSTIVGPCTLEFTLMLSCCSIRWAASEILDNRDSRNTAPTDVYALGMEIVTGRLPYTDRNERGVVLAVLRKELPPRPDFKLLLGDAELGDHLWLLLMRCWAYEPGERPTALEIKDEDSKSRECSELVKSREHLVWVAYLEGQDE
ncbi:hypothetical protein BDV93DRAFT_504675 [Ceratobasidium sp. AG-I]|nr:hypothetical protein BDV93DRAFT_504675 [Ceratobasidium sp. AG-I]